MKSRLLVFLLVVGLIFGLLSSSKNVSAEDDWGESVGPGVRYQRYVLPGPVVVHVARMDRNHPDVILESSIGQGRLIWGGDTVSTMANRYNEAINFWKPTQNDEWGATNRVLVAINGDYQPDWNTLVPRGGQTHSGWYSKRHREFEHGFAWKLDRSAFIGNGIYHWGEKQRIWTPDFVIYEQLKAINIVRPENTLVLYTPEYNWRSWPVTTGDVVDVLVEFHTPVWIMPLNNYASGTVKKVNTGNGGTPIPFDHVVVSYKGYGPTRDLLLGLSEGDEIRISQEISYINPPGAGDWTKTFASIEGDFIFLANGNVIKYHKDQPDRRPRTAVALNDQYIFFIVVDGDKPAYSVGMIYDELGPFAKDRLGATYGLALDGGGSSAMVINGELVSRPSASCFYQHHVFLPFIVDSTAVPEPVVYDPYVNFQVPRYGPCERSVVNGLMMVEVEHNEASTTFEAGGIVRTLGQVSLRLGPGSNYWILNTLGADTTLEILEHSLGLEGVYAKGQYWWKVRTSSGLEGWIIEAALESVEQEPEPEPEP